MYIQGNTAPASVQTEPNGFMHVVAATQADVYRTLGFVSSKQRLLQMDFQRRVGRGNLTVFLGSSAALPIDIYFRQLGWYAPPHHASISQGNSLVIKRLMQLMQVPQSGFLGASARARCQSFLRCFR